SSRPFGRPRRWWRSVPSSTRRCAWRSRWTPSSWRTSRPGGGVRKSEVAQIGFSPNLRFVHPCPVVDLPARPPAPTPSRWTLPVLIGFVGVALAVLLVVPILLDAQIDALRAEI